MLDALSTSPSSTVVLPVSGLAHRLAAASFLLAWRASRNPSRSGSPVRPVKPANSARSVRSVSTESRGRATETCALLRHANDSDSSARREGHAHVDAADSATLRSERRAVRNRCSVLASRVKSGPSAGAQAHAMLVLSSMALQMQRGVMAWVKSEEALCRSVSARRRMIEVVVALWGRKRHG